MAKSWFFPLIYTTLHSCHAPCLRLDHTPTPRLLGSLHKVAAVFRGGLVEHFSRCSRLKPLACRHFSRGVAFTVAPQLGIPTYWRYAGSGRD